MSVHATLDADLDRYVADPGSFQNPYPMLRAVRDRSPLCPTSVGPWVITSHDVAESALRSPDVGRHGAAQLEAAQIAGDAPSGADAAEIYMSMFIAMDPPDHTRLRRLAAPAFRPSVIKTFRDLIDEVSDDLVARITEKGEIDFVQDFAYPLPQTVICRMLGVPPQDEGDWNRWVYTIANVNRASFKDGEPSDLRDALIGLAGYCRELVRARRGTGGDDLLGALIAVQEAGDGLTEDELVGTLLLLIVAGHETTVNLLGSGMYLLARDREQWRALQQDPGLAAAAVEESMRFEPPARVSPRFVRRSIQLAGQTVEAGERLVVVVPAVNRDPDRFEDPDTFDIRRERPSSMAFGYGAHFCLGAPLARMEGTMAFAKLAQLDVELRGDIWWRDAAHRSLRDLQLSVRPIAAT